MRIETKSVNVLVLEDSDVVKFMDIIDLMRLVKLNKKDIEKYENSVQSKLLYGDMIRDMIDSLRYLSSLLFEMGLITNNEWIKVFGSMIDSEVFTRQMRSLWKSQSNECEELIRFLESFKDS